MGHDGVIGLEERAEAHSRAISGAAAKAFVEMCWIVVLDAGLGNGHGNDAITD